MRLNFELKHEAGHYIKIKYDWLQMDQATGKADFVETDTGFLRDWTLLQIEGEEPVSTETLEEAKGKVGGKDKKGDPKKAPAGKMEEISDNRPRKVMYERDFAAENNGTGLKVNQDLAVALSEAFITVQIFDVDKETQAETLLEKLSFDLSPLLFPKSNVEVSNTQTYKYIHAHTVIVNSLEQNLLVYDQLGISRIICSVYSN